MCLEVFRLEVFLLAVAAGSCNSLARGSLFNLLPAEPVWVVRHLRVSRIGREGLRPNGPRAGLWPRFHGDDDDDDDDDDMVH